MEQRRCDACGAAFSAAKSWQRFCSPACRLRQHRADQRRPATTLEVALEAALELARAGDDAAALRRLAEVLPRSAPSLADRYRRALEDGATQAGIAKACGLADGSLLSRWSRGKAKLSAKVEAALERALEAQNRWGR